MDELKTRISILLFEENPVAGLNGSVEPLVKELKARWNINHTYQDVEDILILIRADQESEEVVVYPDDSFEGF